MNFKPKYKEKNKKSSKTPTFNKFYQQMSKKGEKERGKSQIREFSQGLVRKNPQEIQEKANLMKYLGIQAKI